MKKIITQKSLLGRVLKVIRENSLIQKDDVIVVALSGGPDSLCLTLILKELAERLQITLKACHYNHRLRGEESGEDESFVRNFCERQGIDLIFGQAEKANLFKNEEEARVARYAFFEKILQEGSGDKVAIAHNANDLSETFFMRLIRGSGLSGLRSIPLSREEKFIRPLLYSSKKEIVGYLKSRDQGYRIDSSNLSLDFTRNKIRCELIPLLEKYNPNILETILNTVSVINDDYDYIEKSSAAELEVMTVREGDNVVLDWKKWQVLHPALRMMTLRLAIAKMVELKNITTKQLSELEKVLLKGEGRKHKVLPSSLKIELKDAKIILSKIKRNKGNG